MSAPETEAGRALLAHMGWHGRTSDLAYLIAAIEREAARIDAERLGVAMWGMDFTDAHRDVMAFARRVAAEYARLSESVE